MSLKSPEAVLRSAIIADTSLASLVGSRVYPVIAPASASLPFVTWRRSGIQRSQTLGAPMGVPRLSVEYAVYAATYEAAREVADRMRVVLDGYGGTVDNVVVRQVSLEQESDDFVALAGAEMPPAFQITMVFDVWWQET
jgi:hypothetical protein